MGWDQKEPWGGGSAGVAKRRCSGTASTNKLVLPPLQGGCVYTSTMRRQQQLLQIEIVRRQCNLTLLTAATDGPQPNTGIPMLEASLFVPEMLGPLVPLPFAVEPDQRLFVGEGLFPIKLWSGMV
ncbi:hypothetical protein ASPTUDRAFT_118985 [Aspergillus tubingensis CBS 134.48]|uniref:Uncharacterized protein n=1 Tax=Aspergillus tubingensis (strain CBS 134.48) TaxID=767770 RepID=A0A1L9N8M0_ASPTC|nr:hypothetical protein ASPTUDRAFT_118985 [Aspergillus tubingensis CBS 134.48]